MAGSMDGTGGVGNGLRRRLGDLLVQEGLLTAEMLQRALSAQMRAGGGMKLGGFLVGSGVIPERVLLETLGRIHRCPWVGWTELSAADPAAFGLLPDKRAFKLGAFPYSIEKKTLKVAFSDPSNLAAIDEVAALTGCRVVPAVASEARLMQAHEKFYGRPLGQTFWNLLNRMNRPKPPAPAATRPVVPPPPPRFSGPDPAEEDPESDAPLAPDYTPQSPPAAFLSDEAEMHEPPTSAGGTAIRTSPPDPFSDGYSLADFVADALAFGVPAEHIFETRPGEPIARPPRPPEVEAEAQDPGDPLPREEEHEETHPSRRGGPAAKVG
jgi:hypothetical protein